jgi:tellurium resistance protein TerD
MLQWSTGISIAISIFNQLSSIEPMGVSLQKGGNISLSEQSPGLKTVRVCLGWEERETEGADFDLDASCFMLAANDKVRNDADFIFYNQLKSKCGSVEHSGDNLTGEGEGDAEVLLVRLDKVPGDIVKLEFTVTIHEFDKRRQNFGMVSDAYIRIVNDANDEEIARFDLSEDASTCTAMIFGEIYRHSGSWKFRAVGQGFPHGLGQLAKTYGVNVA